MPAESRAIQPRAGVIGLKGIGSVHVAALRANGVPVAGIASSSHESAKRHAARLGIHRAHPDAQSLIADPDIDVVHVCVPNGLHAEYSRLALEHGKHVVCEKPLATSSKAATEFTQLARDADRVAATCYHLRYTPGIAALRDLVRAGALGRIDMVRGSFLIDEVGTLLNDSAHWMFDPALMGPSLVFADLGVHWWDLVEWVTGLDAVSVTATPQAAGTSHGDAAGAVLLRLSGDAIASLCLSLAAPGYANHADLEVIGALGAASWSLDHADHVDVHLRSGERSTDTRREPTPDQRNIAAVRDAFARMMAATYASIRGDAARPSYPDFEAGRRGVEILEAVIESVASRRWTEIGRAHADLAGMRVGQGSSVEA